MSKKDYVTIAARIKARLDAWSNVDCSESRAVHAAMRELANGIAIDCWNARKEFNRTKFLAACGF